MAVVVHNFSCPSGFEPEDLNRSELFENIDNNEDGNIEFWMIKTPLNFDISLLSGKELEEHFNIPKEESDIEYIAKASVNHPICKTFQTIFPHRSKNQLKIGPSFKGYVDIVQSVKIPKLNSPVFLPYERPREIPLNLKQRYVPYGSHSPPRISETPNVKEKKKKRKRNSESTCFSLPNDVDQIEAEHSPLKKKKKKHKNSLHENDISVDMTDNSFLLPPLTPEMEVSDLNESSNLTFTEMKEPDSLKTPLNGKKRKKKNIDKLEDASFIKDDVTSTPKELHSQSSICENDEISTESRKKKKKKRKSSENSFLQNLPKNISLQEDVQENGLLQNGLDFGDCSLDDPNSSLKSSSQKKKKKKHKNQHEIKTNINDDNNKMPHLNKSSVNSIQLSNQDSSLGKEMVGEISIPDTDSNQESVGKGHSAKLLETNHSNSLVFDQSISSSQKKKKKHKKKKRADNSLDGTYLQLNTSIEEYVADNTTMDIVNAAGDLAQPIPKVGFSSSKKKKSKKEKGSGDFLEDDVESMNISLMTDKKLAKKDSGLGSLDVSLNLNSSTENSFLEQSNSLLKKKKKKKHKKKSISNIS